MNFYSTLVFIHVTTAIFGLGPLAALVFITSRGSSAQVSMERVARDLRIVRWSLAGMFVTGAAIIAMTHGALGETGWMRVSFALFVLLGLFHGLASRQVKKAQLATSAILPRALNPMLWAMCATVVAITWLMEAKPW